MKTMLEMVNHARTYLASDIHLSADMPLMFRINGELKPIEMDTSLVHDIIMGLLDDNQKEMLAQGHDLDFAYQTPDGERQRVNVFRQQGLLAATIRLLNTTIPTLEQLGLPPVIKELVNHPNGLILVTGPTGSGKSTTLAAAINHINLNNAAHILTLEDPVEYVYPKGRSLVHQREVGRDTHSFAASLRSALREDPDVILVGEMRDFETISAAITAAETGHLVLSTLHTMGAAQTIDRIIDACPEGMHQQIRTQLSQILRGVVTQKLLPLRSGNGRCVATEILLGSDAALNMIRENKCFQLSAVMQSSAAMGMHTMNGDLARLVREGKIDVQTAMLNSNDRRDLQQFIG